MLRTLTGTVIQAKTSIHPVTIIQITVKNELGQDRIQKVWHFYVKLTRNV